jgi:serine/threonine-protein kinase
MIPGRVIDDKYRIRRVIGRGGMSVVAEAEDLVHGHHVAVKFLRTDVARALAAEPRFFREARLAARLMSKHTCRVTDAGVWESGPYLVLELLQGRTLSQEMRVRGVLSEIEACEIILQACDALAEAHALGIVHRDVKPGNFFMCANPRGQLHVKVLDFGVAKIPASVVTRHGEGSLTDGNTLIGTPSYISPEQLQNSKIVDARTDIWGLGVILYEMLAGYPPFRDPWVPRMLVKIAREPHLPLREICPGIAPEIDRIVQRCLAKNPADRYRGAADLGLALSDLAPPPEYLLERLMAFSTSIPSMPALSSRPPKADSIPQFDLGINNSIDPYTTAVRHLEHTRRLSAPVTAALGGILAGSLAVGLWWGNRSIASLRMETSATMSDLATVASPAPSVLPSAVPRTVRLELSATPDDAQWWLDDVLLGPSRYYGHATRDERTHVLTARAPDHEPRSLNVYLDRDVSLSLALERSPAKTKPGHPSPAAAQSAPAAKSKREPKVQGIDSSNPYAHE